MDTIEFDILIGNKKPAKPNWLRVLQVLVEPQ